MIKLRENIANDIMEVFLKTHVFSEYLPEVEKASDNII
jgi:hypothetical protein